MNIIRRANLSQIIKIEYQILILTNFSIKLQISNITGEILCWEQGTGNNGVQILGRHTLWHSLCTAHYAVLLLREKFQIFSNISNISKYLQIFQNICKHFKYWVDTRCALHTMQFSFSERNFKYFKYFKIFANISNIG